MKYFGKYLAKYFMANIVQLWQILYNYDKRKTRMESIELKYFFLNILFIDTL